MQRRDCLKLLAGAALLPRHAFATGRVSTNLGAPGPAFGTWASTNPLTPEPYPHYALTHDDEAFLDDMQRRACLFFVEQASPTTGQVLDRAAANNTTGKLDPAPHGLHRRHRLSASPPSASPTSANISPTPNSASRSSAPSASTPTSSTTTTASSTTSTTSKPASASTRTKSPPSTPRCSSAASSPPAPTSHATPTSTSSPPSSTTASTGPGCSMAAPPSPWAGIPSPVSSTRAGSATASS